MKLYSLAAMKRTIVGLGVLVAVAAVAPAQVGLVQPGAAPKSAPVVQNSPVRITIEQGKKTDINSVATSMRPGRGLGDGRVESIPGDLPNTVALFYHVRLDNVGTRLLTNLTVRWTLVWGDEKKKTRLTEGAKTCNIQPVRNFEFQTDPITVRPSQPKSGGGKITLEQTQELYGCYIEVLEGEKLIGAAARPKELAPVVRQIRSAPR